MAVRDAGCEMVEVILVKRRAKAGEVGLFLDNQVFEEEWSSLPLDTEVKAECTVPANLKYLKFFWALVGKIVDNSPDDRWLDKEDCSNELRLQARHYKAIHDPLRGKTELKPKSVSGLSADTWIRLLRRCTHIVITQYLPGMEESALKAEIEKMLGMDVFAQPAPKSTKPKGGADAKPPESPPHGDVSTAPAVPRSGPQTEDEYVTACRGWIAKQTDHRKALEYFDSEEQIAKRAELKLKVGIQKMLRRELAEHCEKQGALHG